MEDNQEKPIAYKSGDQYQIPYEGSLGLLALGHVGLKLWREKRKEVDEAIAKEKAAKEAQEQGEQTTKTDQN